MEDVLLASGLPALFLVSFLAATVLPLGSEWLLVALIMQHFALEPVVATATLGNYLGACTTYALGVWGADFAIRKLVRIDADELERAQRLYRRYGSWSLLFSWLPVVGDPLCLLGGLLRVNFVTFSLLVFAGKLGRYLTIGLLTRATMGS
ncbi:MAG: YqaA family protein [Thermodesulfobacteriota bacterium]